MCIRDRLRETLEAIEEQEKEKMFQRRERQRRQEELKEGQRLLEESLRQAAVNTPEGTEVHPNPHDANKRPLRSALKKTNTITTTATIEHEEDKTEKAPSDEEDSTDDDDSTSGDDIQTLPARITETLRKQKAEDGIRDVERSRGLGDVYKRQSVPSGVFTAA